MTAFLSTSLAAGERSDHRRGSGRQVTAAPHTPRALQAPLPALPRRGPDLPPTGGGEETRSPAAPLPFRLRLRSCGLRPPGLKVSPLATSSTWSAAFTEAARGRARRGRAAGGGRARRCRGRLQRRLCIGSMRATTGSDARPMQANSSRPTPCAARQCRDRDRPHRRHRRRLRLRLSGFGRRRRGCALEPDPGGIACCGRARAGRLRAPRPPASASRRGGRRLAHRHRCTGDAHVVARRLGL